VILALEDTHFSGAINAAAAGLSRAEITNRNPSRMLVANILIFAPGGGLTPKARHFIGVVLPVV